MRREEEEEDTASQTKSPGAVLLPDHNGSSSSGGGCVRALSADRFYGWKPSLSGLAIRLATLIAIVGILIALGLGLRYTDGLPRSEDFSQLTFDWHIDPSSYLQPFNTSFQYNVLLDGHAHSTYSDGYMNVRQLLEWHIGTCI